MGHPYLLPLFNFVINLTIANFNLITDEKQIQNTYLNQSKIWMTIHIFSASFFGLAIILGKTWEAPFLFAAIYNLTAFISLFLFIKLLKPELLSKKVYRIIIYNYKANKALFPCILSGIATFPIFALSLKYIEIIPAIIIFETSPMFLTIIMDRIFLKTGKFNKLTPESILLFLFGLIGFAFTILSQSLNPYPDIKFNKTELIGGTLALISGFFNALAPPYSIKHATIIQKTIKFIPITKTNEFFCSIFSLCIHRLVTGIFLLITAIYIKELFSLNILSTGLITGIFITAISSATIRKVNIETKNLEINGLSYTIPILTVTWLLIFTSPTYFHQDLFIIGTTAIAISNVLLNFNTTYSSTQKFLIIFTWFIITTVYLY